MILRSLYLLLALWGAIQPMRYFIGWLSRHDWSLQSLIDAWFATAATTGLMWDATIAAVALVVWVLAETFVRRNWSALVVIPVTFLIGVGCGLPLYLFLRTRPVT
ncbi:hypothetical protein AQS8620_02039 [Aquimixticola soesokkakensis]|uniref:K+-transporting ATPase, A chain n=1 Tax=Aquimixticola soesokkakensis TaxID=1519096 RepID=A0A1Y5SU60_9RHOB|nr:DUF2834 domain-containing protein [Aquimixticola soesokkakensis]SLN48609.1 hypothetical protein AQS8620_02039 [Aquimixticola soesokkakensis]